jgi:hypothetical protein
MDRCKDDEPQLAAIDGTAREVACWLHRDGAQVPAELAMSDTRTTLREPVRQVIDP